MGIEWFRDLVICILGVITTVVLILIAILCVLIYRKSRTLLDTMHLISQKSNSILNSVGSTSENVRLITSDVREAMLNPVTQIIATIQGIRYGVSLFNKVFKKEEEQQND